MARQNKDKLRDLNQGCEHLISNRTAKQTDMELVINNSL